MFKKKSTRGGEIYNVIPGKGAYLVMGDGKLLFGSRSKRKGIINSLLRVFGQGSCNVG